MVTAAKAVEGQGTPAGSTAGEFAAGWRVLVAAALGVTCGITAVPIYTIGAFVGPLEQAHGWSRSSIQSAIVFAYLTLIVAGPLAGLLADRIGARRVAIYSVLGLSAAVFVCALLGNTLAGLYAGYALIGILGAGTSPVVWTRAVSGWFVRNRGLAFGITLMGTGIFATLGPKFVTAAVQSCGWQCGYGALGALPLILVLPIVLAWFRERAVASTGSPSATPTTAETQGLDLPAAMRKRQFWIIGITFLCFSTGISGFIANFIPMLTDSGVTREAAAGFAGVIGIAVMVGRVAAGLLLDRVPAAWLSAAVMALPTAGFLLSATGQAPPLVLAALVGLAGGAEFDLVAFMTARYFGLRHYGKLYGILFSPIIAGAAIGPLLFSLGYERYGGYGPVLAGCGIVFGLAAAAQLALGSDRNISHGIRQAD